MMQKRQPPSRSEGGRYGAFQDASRASGIMLISIRRVIVKYNCLAAGGIYN
jgi:hypothetical protein